MTRTWWIIPPAIASLSFFVSEVIFRRALGHLDLFNVPNKANFLTMSAEERAPVMHELRALLHLMLLGVFVALAAVQLGGYQAAQRGAAALPAWVIPVVIAALVGTAVVVARSYRRVDALTTSRPAASPR